MLRFERHFAHPPQHVWRAVTEPSELAHWFPGEVTLELALGAEVTFSNEGFDLDHELVPSSGPVTALQPPRLFAFTWGKDLLTFELSNEGDGCMLVFTHSFADRASALRPAAGWHVCLDALASLLEGGAADGDRWAGHYER